jgi:ribonuclease-3
LLDDLKTINPELLKRALTHSSYSKDHPDCLHNERLEFFGDSVLKLVFSKYLYDRFPDSGEGLLTKYRSRLVSDDLIATIAEKKLNLVQHIKISQAMKHQRISRSILADALEAVVGAVYLDRGLEFTEAFIMALWQDFIEQALVDAIEIDFKSMLQEQLQKIHKEHPVYKTIQSDGPAHKKSFVVGVFLGDQCLGQGAGVNKKIAGQAAAKNALDKINGG